MAADENTNPRNESPWELLRSDLRVVSADVADVKKLSRDTFNLSFKLNQRFDGIEQRVKAIEATRLWLPLAAILLSALALARAW